MVSTANPDLGGGRVTANPDLACPPGSHAGDDGCTIDVSWSDNGLVSPSRDHQGQFVVEAGGAAYLYVVGGTDHYASYLLDDVQRATIMSNGSVGPFQQTGSLPHGLASMGVAVIDDRVILAGGITPDLIHPTLGNGTLVAKIANDGTIESWSTGPSIGAGREHTALVVRDHDIYLIGGLVGNDGTTNVERTTLNSDGTLSDFVQMTQLPDKRSHHAAVLVNDAIYVIGGIIGGPIGGTSYDDVLRAPIAADGTLGEWTQVSTLPAPLATHSANVFDGRIFVFGGLEDDVTDHVRSTAILSDGTLGDWIDGTPLPDPRAHVLETPIYRQHVYSIAGYGADYKVRQQVVVGTLQ